jgi:hypothetical protein
MIQSLKIPSFPFSVYIGRFLETKGNEHGNEVETKLFFLGKIGNEVCLTLGNETGAFVACSFPPSTDLIIAPLFA